MREAIAPVRAFDQPRPEVRGGVREPRGGRAVCREYVTDDRETRFDRALEHGRELVDKALQLDPESGDAYLQRAHLTAFDDVQTAEVDYRRGLELSPNSAQGYAGLAAVVYEDPKRRDQALELLDRARKLDPLKPEYDVTKSIFLLYERSDIKGADELLSEVVKRNPNYLPGLARLCELRSGVQGQLAEGIMYCERARGLDPLSEAARLSLTNAYLSLRDEQAAEAMVGDDPREADVARVMLLAYRRDRLRAGELAWCSSVAPTAQHRGDRIRCNPHARSHDRRLRTCACRSRPARRRVVGDAGERSSRTVQASAMRKSRSPTCCSTAASRSEAGSCSAQSSPA